MGQSAPPRPGPEKLDANFALPRNAVANQSLDRILMADTATAAAAARRHIPLGYAEAPVQWVDVAVLPEAGDNCAIARVVIEAGTTIEVAPGVPPLTVSHTILEGHRFAVRPIAAGERLLSWGLVFGEATKPIAPGHYCVNDRVLASLKTRHYDGIKNLSFPEGGNFNDLIVPLSVAEVEATYTGPSPQVPLLPSAGDTWQGFSRGPARGSGTRNYVILIGATSVSAGYVRALEGAIKKAGLAAGYPAIDGVVAVAHTEGGGSRDDPEGKPHNFGLLCATLTAFMVHPNVAAALVVDYGSANEALWIDDLQAYAAGERGGERGGARGRVKGKRRCILCGYVWMVLGEGFVLVCCAGGRAGMRRVAECVVAKTGSGEGNNKRGMI